MNFFFFKYIIHSFFLTYYFFVYKVIVKIIAEFDQMSVKKHALLQRVAGATSRQEQIELARISSSHRLSATLLPIRSVGVQGIFIIFLNYHLFFPAKLQFIAIFR